MVLSFFRKLSESRRDSKMVKIASIVSASVLEPEDREFDASLGMLVLVVKKLISNFVPILPRRH